MKWKKVLYLSFIIVFLFSVKLCAYASITEKQGEDLAEYAKAFVEKGNSRKDENGFPLLTYGLTGNWNKNVQIRNNGYNERLTTVGNNGYYYRNGRYIQLGDKWMMDCGTFVTYTLKKTLGLELYNGSEPWHVQDIYNDALKGANSKYFDFVYRGVSVYNIDYSKLQKGDVIARITSKGNHGMVYVGDGYIAHANRDMIKSYGDNKVSGFQVNKLNHYFLGGTVVRIMRIKDGIIPEDFEMDSKLIWPDTGEEEILLERQRNQNIIINEILLADENNSKTNVENYELSKNIQDENIIKKYSTPLAKSKKLYTMLFELIK